MTTVFAIILWVVAFICILSALHIFVKRSDDISDDEKDDATMFVYSIAGAVYSIITVLYLVGGIHVVLGLVAVAIASFILSIFLD